LTCSDACKQAAHRKRHRKLRTKFGDMKNSAPFDSAIVDFRNAETVTKLRLVEEDEAA
jgi:hypothetical protein